MSKFRQRKSDSVSLKDIIWVCYSFFNWGFFQLDRWNNAIKSFFINLYLFWNLVCFYHLRMYFFQHFLSILQWNNVTIMLNRWIYILEHFWLISQKQNIVTVVKYFSQENQIGRTGMVFFCYSGNTCTYQNHRSF